MTTYDTNSTFNQCLLWTIFITAFTICFSLLLHLTYKVFIAKKHSKIPIRCSITCFSIGGLIFYCSCLITLLYADITIDSIYWDGISYAVTSIIWGQANVCTYLLFLSRIYLIFQDSPSYAEPKKTYYCLYSFCAATYAAQICCGILEVFALMGMLTPKNEVLYMNIGIITEVVSDLIVNISLIWLFIKKLIMVASAMDNVMDIKDMNINDEDYQPLNIKQKRLMYIATKQTILSTFGTMTTQIWLVICVAMNFILPSNVSFNVKYAFHLIADFAVIMDCVMNSYAICLSFTFNDKWYMKLCGCCHRWCNRRCRKTTARRITATDNNIQFTQPLLVSSPNTY